jgi:hypothetical protein
VTQWVEVDVASQGHTEDEALENLRDALELHFTPPVATLVPVTVDQLKHSTSRRSRQHVNSPQRQLWEEDYFKNN